MPNDLNFINTPLSISELQSISYDYNTCNCDLQHGYINKFRDITAPINIPDGFNHINQTECSAFKIILFCYDYDQSYQLNIYLNITSSSAT